MKNRRCDQRPFTCFEVAHIIGSVCDRLGARGAAEANLVDRSFEQRVERGSHEKVELADLGELTQHLWRGESRVLNDAPDPRVECLTAAVPAQIERDDLVEGRRRRQCIGRQPEARCEPSGDVGPVLN